MGKTNGQSVTINIEANTSELESKLRVIAKHATALAEDLRKMDEEQCPHCGSRDVDVARLHGDQKDSYQLVIECRTCEVTNYSTESE